MDSGVNRNPLHIAIFNCAAHGHVNPTLGMVRELVARHHRVSYTTTRSFAPLIAGAGAEAVLFQPAKSQGSPGPNDMNYVVRELAAEARENFPQLLAAFENDRPDIIAWGPLSWHGRILAELWGIPSVMLNPTHVNYAGQSEEWLGITDEEWPSYPVMAQMLEENGFSCQLYPLLSSWEHAIAFIPRAFQSRAETVKDGVAFVGPELISRDPPEGWSSATTDKPVMLVSLGSVYNHQAAFFRTCIRAFADTEWQVILTIGHHVERSELGLIPANIAVHNQIPQLEVLRTASLFITHAGMNSTMESVMFGVPMIAVPQTAEQRTSARQIGQMGLGLHLSPESVTPQSLRDAAERIAADPSFRQNIIRLQQEIEQSGGSVAAVDYIEQIVAQNSIAHAV